MGNGALAADPKSQTEVLVLDLETLSESVDLECKAAQGKDGAGALPHSFWESYSAMANTQGGDIFLGIEEKPRGVFRALGIKDLEKVRKAIWDNAHNKKQVSENLLSDADVQILLVDGDKAVIRVSVPRATRHQRPVYLGSNPLGGTYLRRSDGDYLATEEQVRRLLAERIEDARDNRVLDGYGLDDLDMTTVAAYRNRLSAVKPGHPWLDLDIPAFLDCIGAYGKDRERKVSGVRLAGLLMFGRAEVIRDVLPHYMVDYQERPEAKAEKRWIDRLIPDGTWSGNLYDFFRQTYQRLTKGLKVPFQLQDGQRIEDTPQNEALREALVNTIVHADFTGRSSVLIVKRPDMFGFRNPGLMRIPIDLALVGGNSDCRNRRLQTMFQLVGYGDHAGSGIPKIYKNWDAEQWRRPLLYEVTEPEQTLMELRMVSLFPKEVVERLDHQFGAAFKDLPELERLAMVTVATERTINHARLREICTDHSFDITKALANLVRSGMLESEGIGRGTVYFLPGFKVPRLADAFEDAPSVTTSSGATDQTSGGPEASSGGLREILRSRLTGQFPEGLPKKVARERMRQIILNLCTGHYVPISVLAATLGRSDEALRKEYLNPMVVEHVLVRKYPTQPNNPNQAYRTTEQV